MFFKIIYCSSHQNDPLVFCRKLYSDASSSEPGWCAVDRSSHWKDGVTHRQWNSVGSSIFTWSPWYISSGFLTSLYCHAWCLQNNQANFYTETSKPCRCMYVVVWHLLKYQIESRLVGILQNKKLFHNSKLVWPLSINQSREVISRVLEILNIYESQFWSCQEGT